MEISWSGNSISHLSLHYRKPSLKFSPNVQLGLEYIPIFILYGITIYFCVTSVLASIELGKEQEEFIANSELEILIETEEGPHKKREEFYSFWEFFFLGLVCMLHVLFELIQYWFVNVKAKIKYGETKKLSEAQYVKVTPKPHRGNAEIVPLEDWKGVKYFRFQKRTYICEISRDKVTRILFRKWTPSTNLPLSRYCQSKGMDTISAKNHISQFGSNKFDIPSPTFLELYKQQLVTPIAVFQLFSIALWSLDSYWQYSLFSLSMILLFEATVAFSRIRNLKTLRGMSNPTRNLFVFRDGNWTEINSENLVPGDLISLKRGQVQSNASTNDGIVPCDCLLLTGSMVVNEASLTGESIPQMKESVGEDELINSPSLDMKNLHKLHILFGGTTILQHSISIHSNNLNEVSSTPDGGCLCYVLRTGFYSSQGKLVRMIEFSTDKVKGNTRESLLLLAFLCCFAIVASVYVLKRGLEDSNRSKYELLLHCIMIITSVIPPELPMQMALAVNTSLLALIRQFIFCTEPFRIPLAGKVDVCFFDKTGTITTDELVAVSANSWTPNQQSCEDLKMEDLPLFPSLVIGGCHSLMLIDGKLIGDPIETAALKSINWKLDDSGEYISAFPNSEKPNSNKDGNNQSLSQTTKKNPFNCSVTILHRYHFSSKLQRMSTIARVRIENQKSELWTLVKGSPEMILSLLKSDPDAKPKWYNEKQMELTQKGMRVIALAYRKITDFSEEEACKQPREWAEKDLQFVGFVAFRCLVRKDSKDVIKALKESSHKVIMITGDAILTGAHVASEVEIISPDKNHQLILEALPLKDENKLQWKNVGSGQTMNFDLSNFETLATTYDFCVTGSVFRQATQQYPELWSKLHLFKVFARMTPEEKETILTSLNDKNHFTLMCGDGANDVGALKQAHIGVALLSGFGSANVDKGNKPNTTPPTSSISSLLNPGNLTSEQKQALMAEKKRELERDIQERTARGESFASFRAMAAYIRKEQEEMKKRASTQERNAVFASVGDVLEEGELPMIKLGDASIAAPFTSKIPSIRSTLDIIRQGRCTLVTTLQMYQILALNCLISSYSLSVLYLDGIKYGDTQMTFLGILMAISFISISYARPLEKLSSVRPLNSIFHPAMFFSLLGQFVIHLTCMMYSLSITKPYLPPDYKPKLDGEFEPNLINTVVFLVSAIQQVSVFAVNYKGRPFMQGIQENKALRFSLSAIAFGAFLCAMEFVPEFNAYIQLVKFPDEEFQYTILFILFINIALCYFLDRLLVRIFAPQLLTAN